MKQSGPLTLILFFFFWKFEIEDQYLWKNGPIITIDSSLDIDVLNNSYIGYLKHDTKRKNKFVKISTY